MALKLRKLQIDTFTIKGVAIKLEDGSAGSIDVTYRKISSEEEAAMVSDRVFGVAAFEKIVVAVKGVKDEEDNEVDPDTALEAVRQDRLACRSVVQRFFKLGVTESR